MEAEKQSNMSLYVLRFKNKRIVKIGVSDKLSLRIKVLRKEYNDEFDLVNSYLIGCYCGSRILAFEKELQANTDQFSLTGEDYKMYFKNDGATELRYEGCVDLVLKLIHSKIEITNSFYFHKGISLERNLGSNLPLCIFDEDGSTPYQKVGIAEKLLHCIRSNSGEELKKLDDETIVNLILNQYINTNKMAFANQEKPVYDRAGKKYFANRFKDSNWYWSKPQALAVK